MEGINLRARNLISVCIDTVQGREVSGRIFTKYSPQPIKFSGIGEMLNEIDEYFDFIGFPQASVKSRSFSRENPDDVRGKSGRDGKGELGEHMSSKDLMAVKGDKGTFIVNVKFRQNATWQGNVVWCEKGVTKDFRSALELLKLIDSSLDEINPTV